MKQRIIVLLLTVFFCVTGFAQSWSSDPHCLGIIYVDVDKSELLGSGSEMYLQGRIPDVASMTNFSMWSMQGLGSPILYSTNGIYFYFSITKMSLKWAYKMDPDGVFTAELYTGEDVTNTIVPGKGFYIVQYQIADFKQ